jgi:2-isopropylmalate synthase
MFSQGINPELELEHINEIIEVYERCCKMDIGMRHPYAGKLVFTAFSGSHQDAINKGMHAMQERGDGIWEVPYLPVDPSDLGRAYEPIVRINSQSGKGGVAFVMDTYYGFKLPKGMHKEFADVIQVIAEEHGEVAPETIMDKFTEEYLTFKTDSEYPYTFSSCKIEDVEETEHGDTQATMDFKYKGEDKHIVITGNGPIDAVKNALHEGTGINMKINDYSEHSLSVGSKAKAAAYICVTDLDTGKTTYGVGVSTNITRASIRAVFSALNRLSK